MRRYAVIWVGIAISHGKAGWVDRQWPEWVPTHRHTHTHHGTSVGRSGVRAFSHLVDPLGGTDLRLQFTGAVRICLVADDEAHAILTHRVMELNPPWTEWVPAGPFIDHRRWRQVTGVASGGRRPTWTAWQGSRRSTSECQDGPSNLVQCDAGDTCVIISLEEPRNAGQYSIVESTDMVW